MEQKHLSMVIIHIQSVDAYLKFARGGGTHATFLRQVIFIQLQPQVCRLIRGRVSRIPFKKLPSKFHSARTSGLGSVSFSYT